MIAPVMLERDRRTWRVLIAMARETTAKPAVRRSIAAFELAGNAAMAAVMPDPRTAYQRPFLQLINFASRWRCLDEAHRMANADVVRDLARRCAILIGDEPGDFTPPDPPPPSVAASRLPYKDDTFEEDAA